MHDLHTIKLELLSPLYYYGDPLLDPFGPKGPEAEQLFCFALDPVQAQSIEPDPRLFLGDVLLRSYADPSPAASGPAPERAESGNADRGERLVLPAGKYLFAQVREILDREAFINMAIEVQKDGLWEGFSPDSRLYLRYLYEDQGPVTQVLRPIP
ncbi:MAG: hypothetical protein LBD78_02820 [Spirochaetaceae bacterium]|jgi:hypothetical protein|nr:hypothetical protein [Spirochaetaceae bacterium]